MAPKKAGGYEPRFGTYLIPELPEHDAAVAKIQAAARGEITSKESN
ncbi:hypothetical protein [Cryobacterium sp. TMT1-21]|nr:hypothetical protein [Cryobacterium sp. TMT1-21]